METKLKSSFTAALGFGGRLGGLQPDSLKHTSRVHSNIPFCEQSPRQNRFSFRNYIAMASRRALNAVLRSGIRCRFDVAHSKHTVAASYQAFERSMLQNGDAIALPSRGMVSSNHFSIVPWFQQRAGISVAGEGADSHDDFKPVQKESSAAPSVTEHIEQDIKENQVMVYMKGVPEAPQCGFSAMVVRILDEYGVEYKTRNVLADPELRSAIKDFSKWPTVPQVYVNGEFVGGSDILISMHRSGELKTLLKDVKKDPSLP